MSAVPLDNTLAVARAAAIDELRGLAPAFCQWCHPKWQRRGAVSAAYHDPDDGLWKHRDVNGPGAEPGDPELTWGCDSWAIHHRIEELEG